MHSSRLPNAASLCPFAQLNVCRIYKAGMAALGFSDFRKNTPTHTSVPLASNLLEQLTSNDSSYKTSDPANGSADMPPKGVTKRVTRGSLKDMARGEFRVLSPRERQRLSALNPKLLTTTSTRISSPEDPPSRVVRKDLVKNRERKKQPSKGAKVSERPVRPGAGGSPPSSSSLSDAPSNIPPVIPPGGPLPVPLEAGRPPRSGEPSPGVSARVLPTPRETRNTRAVLLARNRQSAPPSRTTKQVLWDSLGKVEAELVEQRGANAERIYNLEEALAEARRQRSPTVADLRSPTPSARRTQELLDENQQLRSQIEVLKASVAEGSSEQERTAKSPQDAAAKEKRGAQILSLSGIGATESASPARMSPRRSPRGSPASQALESSLAAAPHSPKVPTPQKTQSKPDTSLPKMNGRRIIRNVSTPVIPQEVDDGGKLNSWPAVRAPWSKGLQNPGNMCYRNAVLQALFHVPGFYRHLGAMHKDCAFNNDQCVVCALQMLAHIYWNNKAYKQASHGHMDTLQGPTVPLEDFNRACNSNPNLALADDFALSYQADAAEFVTYLMAQVREVDAATFDTMFVLETENSWTCQYCSTTHTKREPLVEALMAVGTSQCEDESLDREGPSEGLPLTNYLERYFNTRQELRCDSAQCKDSGGPGDKMIKGPPYTKRIIRAPNVLAIKMQRAWSKFDLGRDLSKAKNGNKIFERIPFEEYLSLGQYTKNGEALIYRLEGLVAHQGPSLDSGHYISAVRAFNGHEFQSLNDSNFVRQHWNGTMEEMRNPASEWTDARFRNLDFEANPVDCFQPYILIYSKVIL